jgi:hypothetical protein
METPETNKLIEEAVADVMGKLVHKGSAEQPAPMVVSTVTGADIITIYNRITGEPSQTLKYMLASQLKKKDGAGRPVYTTVKPDVLPTKGTLKCMLHPDDPNRKHYTELGLPVCRKSNLTSPYQVLRHMQKRHQMEWKTIESEKQEVDKLEQREFQRGMLKKLYETPDEEEPTSVVEHAPLYVSEKDKKQIAKK